MTTHTHDHIWSAIETVAAHSALTMSGLARKSGLDATAFNKSKRVGPDGRDRWPSVESLNKLLAATGTSWSEFARILEQRAFQPATTLFVGKRTKA